MFKSIITAVATASIAVAGVATGAEAATGCNTLPSGWDICTIDRGDYGTDSIGVFKQNDVMVAQLSVICTGNGGHRWTGERDTRYVAYSDMQAVATWWCANY